MIVSNERWLDRPLLHIYNEQMSSDAPVVIFVHGFLSAKEHNLHYAYHLVAKGVRVLLPDAPLHGERTKHYTKQQMEFQFWNIVLQMVQEVGELQQELQQRYHPTKIALAGTSMGGIVTSGSLCIYDWIDTAAICMGVTSYSRFAEHQLAALHTAGIDLPLTEEQQRAMLNQLTQFDLEHRPELLEQKPVIFWHGQRDETVPFYLAYPFYEQLQPEASTFVVDERAGHAVTRDGLLAVTKWLAHHLA